MDLSIKLDSIPKDQVVRELDSMLDYARTSISWDGKRLVSIEGYTGTVEINRIVGIYLSAGPRIKDRLNLKERIAFYNLWNKVKSLCKDNSGLNATWIYRYLVPIREFYSKRFEVYPTEKDCTLGPSEEKNFSSINCIISPLKGIKFPSRIEWSFSLRPHEYDILWMGQKPSREGTVQEDTDHCIAYKVPTKEMVKKMIAEMTPVLEKNAKLSKKEALIKAANQYVAILNSIGASQNSCEPETILPLCAENCKKVRNGKLLFEGREFFANQLNGGKEWLGSWSIEIQKLLTDIDCSTATIRYGLATEKEGDLIVIVILHFDSDYKICEINEVHNRIER